ncbi:MAG: hypothetical protein IJA26_04595 [Clostridia bacterium]|nr:hypothetical protein [Clostridia bacterium]
MKNKRKGNWIFTVIFSLISLVYIYPLALVAINSFKKKAFISRYPFELPNAKSFFGWDNYANGIKSIDFFDSLFNSVVIMQVPEHLWR